MGFRQVMDILTRRFRDPPRVGTGGSAPQQEPFERTFSVEGNAFALMGWPVVPVSGPAKPLDSPTLNAGDTPADETILRELLSGPDEPS
jgi:hypothetical protein